MPFRGGDSPSPNQMPASPSPIISAAAQPPYIGARRSLATRDAVANGLRRGYSARQQPFQPPGSLCMSRVSHSQTTMTRQPPPLSSRALRLSVAAGVLPAVLCLALELPELGVGGGSYFNAALIRASISRIDLAMFIASRPSRTSKIMSSGLKPTLKPAT